MVGLGATVVGVVFELFASAFFHAALFFRTPRFLIFALSRLALAAGRGRRRGILRRIGPRGKCGDEGDNDDGNARSDDDASLPMRLRGLRFRLRICRLFFRHQVRGLGLRFSGSGLLAAVQAPSLDLRRFQACESSVWAAEGTMINPREEASLGGRNDAGSDAR